MRRHRPTPLTRRRRRDPPRPLPHPVLFPPSLQPPPPPLVRRHSSSTHRARTRTQSAAAAAPLAHTRTRTHATPPTSPRTRRRPVRETADGRVHSTRNDRARPTYELHTSVRASATLFVGLLLLFHASVSALRFPTKFSPSKPSRACAAAAIRTAHSARVYVDHSGAARAFSSPPNDDARPVYVRSGKKRFLNLNFIRVSDTFFRSTSPPPPSF